MIPDHTNSPGRRKKIRGNRRGATLIDVLTLSSAVALIAALLLPTLSRAREETKLARCMDNLRQIAAASMTYANEDRYENAIPVHTSG